MKRILFFTLLALPLSAQSANFDVAHLREQGQDMIIFPMDSSIDYKSDRSKQEIMYALQLCASSARLAGTAVLIWNSNGRTKFMAPQQWHGFFRSVDMLWVAKNINKKLTCR